MRNFGRMLNDFCADILKDRRRQNTEDNHLGKLAARTPKSARNLAKRKKGLSEQEIQSKLEVGW